MVGSIQNLSFDLTGTSALSGPTGNQSFSTAALSLATLTGTLDASVIACAPVCEPPEALTADPLVAATGTLTTAAALHTLNLPLIISVSESETITAPGEGIPVTAALNLRLHGTVIATSPVPEPATWASLLTGVVGLLAVRARRKRLCVTPERG